MYHQNPRVRDAQNPYRTGVLIGNCWEDKFGREMATQPVSVPILNISAIMKLFRLSCIRYLTKRVSIIENWHYRCEREQVLIPSRQFNCRL